MTANRRVGGSGAASRLAPPSDTGEAVGLDAANLTLTVGFGPSLFDDRFGLAGSRPAALADLPAFPGDTLDPALCGGDLAVQACSDDPQVAVHAVRNLTRIAAGPGRGPLGPARLRQGLGHRDRRTDAAQPVRLQGRHRQHPRRRQRRAGRARLGAAADGSGWMAGGSYLVARRIRMTDRDLGPHLAGRAGDPGRAHQGRRRPARARPASATTVRPAALPATSHVRLAHPSLHGGARLLRRGFNFVDGSDGLGHLDAGLFFLAYQRDPRRASCRSRPSWPATTP